MGCQGPPLYSKQLGVASRTYVLEQGGYPVQLQHMLFPHVALQLLNALMRL